MVEAEDNYCPCALLYLGCSVGRAQSCFLTIPRRLAASLTLLALWVLYLITAPHPCVIQLTGVASLNSAAVFRVRLGGHCREFGVEPCSNGANFCIGQIHSTV